jgi:integrase/recombinase XerD
MHVKKIISEYDTHLRRTIGVAESTRCRYSRYVQHFLRETGTDVFQDKLSYLQPSELIQYVIKQREHHPLPVLKSMITALRSFLRFLQMKGLCEARLVNAVPSFPAWKLSGIPNYLTKEQLRKFLASFDRKSPSGRRDYAIALCLARLGLRRKEVACLTLDDINPQAVQTYRHGGLFQRHAYSSPYGCKPYGAKGCNHQGSRRSLETSKP